MSRPVFRASDLRRLLRSAGELELSQDAIQKLRWFLYAAEHEGNVSLTCRHFGISRSTYLRWASRFDASDVRTLDEHSRSPHTVREPETDPRTIELIRQIRLSDPMVGKETIATMLQEKHGVIVSTSTVGRVIHRHCLFFGDTASHRSKRVQFEEFNQVSPVTNPVRGVAEEIATATDDPLTSPPLYGLTS